MATAVVFIYVKSAYVGLLSRRSESRSQLLQGVHRLVIRAQAGVKSQRLLSEIIIDLQEEL
jgi:hypothetical protein